MMVSNPGILVFTTSSGGRREHAFETGIRLAQQKKVRLDPMVSHTFSLEDYRKMIEVNLHKAKYKAIKTMVTFS